MINNKFEVTLGSEQSSKLGVGVLEKIGQNFQNYEKRHFLKKWKQCKSAW